MQVFNHFVWPRHSLQTALQLALEVYHHDETTRDKNFHFVSIQTIAVTCQLFILNLKYKKYLFQPLVIHLQTFGFLSISPLLPVDRHLHSVDISLFSDFIRQSLRWSAYSSSVCARYSSTLLAQIEVYESLICKS